MSRRIWRTDFHTNFFFMSSSEHASSLDIESKTSHEAETPAVQEEGKEAETVVADEPYSAFPRPLKVFIVTVASASGFMSPFAINIYMPAVPDISRHLHISSAQALLSLTTYLIFQGLSPSIWAPLSDTYGRRPILVCTFLVFLAANLGLSFTNVYWLLLVLRMLQACGASSAIAIGAGCISDVSQQKERGSYMGYFQFGTLLGPSIGPIVGGFMAQAWNWHGVFFFLSAFGGVYMIFLIFFLPESLRALVGNGSLQPVGVWRTIVPLWTKRTYGTKPKPMRMPPKLHIKTMGFDKPWRMYGQPDVALMIATYAIPFGSFTLMSSCLSPVLYDNYELNSWQMGLCFLGIGCGSAAGSIAVGHLLDREYARAMGVHGDQLNLHHVRMKYMPHFNILFSVFFIVNGWLLNYTIYLAAPLIMQFFASWFAVMYFNCINTVLVDIYPQRAASVTAALNIGRCLTAAGFVAASQYIIDAIGYGWTQTIFGLVSLLAPMPMAWAVMRYGPTWKHRRECVSRE